MVSICLFVLVGGFVGELFGLVWCYLFVLIGCWLLA